MAASRQPGELNHAGSPAGGASVWYRWVAPEDGLVAFDTCTSGFDTLLAAYTGEAVGALTPVAGNDDSSACGPSSRQSRVSFAASAGTEYHIAIDGAGATTTGAIALAWTQVPEVSISDVAVTEGDRGTRRVRFDVALSAPSSKTVKVRLSTMSGTARVGGDYQKFAITVTFEPGETVQRVTLRIVGDIKAEGDETFLLQLSQVRNATAVTPEATVTIVDDEPPASDPR